MKTVNVHDAKTHLSGYLARVSEGEEIIIARNGTPVAKLVPIVSDDARVPGRFAGEIHIDPSFDDPTEFAELEEGHPGDPLRNAPSQ